MSEGGETGAVTARRNAKGRFEPGSVGNPGGKNGRGYVPPSIETVIRLWAGRPTQSFAHRPTRDPDGLIHDFPEWCWWRVEEVLRHSAHLNQTQQVELGRNLVRRFVEGVDGLETAWGMTSFCWDLAMSLSHNRYSPRPEAEAWQPLPEGPRRKLKKPLAARAH